MNLIDRWIRPELRALQAYHVADATGLIKLDAMENPHGWPPELVSAWLETLRDLPLNRYPDPQGRAIREALRATVDLPDGMDILLGNGSDELIQILTLAVAAPGRRVLALEPGFVMYRMIARFAGLEYVGVPLRAGDFSIDLPAVLEAIKREQPALVWLAYPNNPTGNRFAAEDMVRIIEAAPGLVIVDEAYAPFTDSSFLGLLGDWPNLLVLRTLSKMGLAGLRLGWLAGPTALIAEFDKLRLPYNINVLTQVTAAFALRHKALLDDQARLIRGERARVFAALAALPGLHPFPSEANFILARTPPGQAPVLFEGLKARGILIKTLDGAHPLLADCLRLTIGTADENDALLDALAALLG